MSRVDWVGRLRTLGIRLGRGLRDAWWVVGVALVLLATLEVAVRVGNVLVGPPAAPVQAAISADVVDPNAHNDWWQPFLRARERSYRPEHTRFDPFRGWWALPFRSEYLNIDEQGRRVTVRSAGPDAADTVVLLGGSTMWGYSAPDAQTIPSLVEAELSRRARPVHAINLAQISFTSSQSIASLVLALRDGLRPVAVVSLDGVNDATVLFRGQQAGEVHNQRVFTDRLEHKSPVRWLLDGLSHRSRLVDLLKPAPDATPIVATDDSCAIVASQYRGQLRVVESLATEFGFIPIMLWQPTLASTAKPLTGWEQRAAADFESMAATIRQCTRAVEAECSGVDSFQSLTQLLDAQSETLFLDQFGHLTLQGNQILAQHIVGRLADSLQQRSAKLHSGAH